MGALACYLATTPQSLIPPDTEQFLGLGELLKKSAAVASHTVKARGTQTSFSVDTLRKDLLIRAP